MKKFSILMLTALLVFFNLKDIKADNRNEDFEKVLTEIGYKEVSIALQETKDHFKRYLALPTRLAPVAFTHSFGRLSDLDGKINDEFEIKFIHKDLPQNHYMIRVKPIEHRVTFEENDIDQIFKLNSGKNALYISTKLLGFNLLVFDKDGWQYALSVDKKISDEVTPEILIDIANSIN